MSKTVPVTTPKDPSDGILEHHKLINVVNKNRLVFNRLFSYPSW